MKEEVSLRKLMNRVLAKALARDEEAQGSRSLWLLVDGVRCVATCKTRLSGHGDEGSRRIDGECLVYLSCAETGALMSGFGWMRFSISERSLRRAPEFFDWALRDARDELRLAPEFVALGEREQIAGVIPSAPARRAARARSL